MNGIRDYRKSVFVQNVSQLIGIENENKENVKRIELTMGCFTLVDKEDFEFLSQWKWHSLVKERNIYAARNTRVDGKRKMQLIHRDILGFWFDDGNLADHRDNNGLHNCRSNLRIATHSINGHNHRMYINNISGYRGVYILRRNKKWGAQIKIQGSRYYLGSFLTPSEAAVAYNNAAIKYYGNNAVLNIVEE